MSEQMNLFQVINNESDSGLLERKKWQEFYNNGKIWIDGEIGIISDDHKHLYDYRTGFKGYEGMPVVRLGVWTKYFDNGQIAWQLDYGDSMYDSKLTRKQYPSYRGDGTLITP